MRVATKGIREIDDRWHETNPEILISQLRHKRQQDRTCLSREESSRGRADDFISEVLELTIKVHNPRERSPKRR